MDEADFVRVWKAAGWRRASKSGLVRTILKSVVPKLNVRRSMKLICCAFWRETFPDCDDTKMLEYIEAYASGSITFLSLRDMYLRHEEPDDSLVNVYADRALRDTMWWTNNIVGSLRVYAARTYEWDKRHLYNYGGLTRIPGSEEQEVRIVLPFIPGYHRINPEWQTTTVVNLARDMHAGSMPILADALEDAGCYDERIQGYMRTGPWYKGHYFIDWLRGLYDD